MLRFYTHESQRRPTWPTTAIINGEEVAYDICDKAKSLDEPLAYQENSTNELCPLTPSATFIGVGVLGRINGVWQTKERPNGWTE